MSNQFTAGEKVGFVRNLVGQVVTLTGRPLSSHQYDLLEEVINTIVKEKNNDEPQTHSDNDQNRI